MIKKLFNTSVLNWKNAHASLYIIIKLIHLWSKYFKLQLNY